MKARHYRHDPMEQPINHPLPMYNAMLAEFRLLPHRASTSAVEVDHLTWYLLGYTIFFTLLIFVLVAFFVLKYRRRNEAPPAYIPSSYKLEIAWSVIPFCFALVMFVWGAKIYISQGHPPPDAMEIDVVGKQWMWKVQHPTGRREIDALHVPLGRDVKLKMTTEDVIHSFYIPAFRLKQDVVPGRYTYEWFHPTKVGRYHLFCAEYCGDDHSHMIGYVTVMPPAEYQKWLQGGSEAAPAPINPGIAATGSQQAPQSTAVNEPPAKTGEKLFSQYGCIACHGQHGEGGIGPSFVGLYNSKVKLSTGQIITADDNYLRRSILNSQAQIVDGYPPVMPTFKGQISEEQVMQLISFIQSLKNGPNDTGSGNGSVQPAVGASKSSQ